MLNLQALKRVEISRGEDRIETMTLVQIYSGYRRLYDALGCEVEGDTEIEIPFALGTALSAVVYISPTPRFGVLDIRGPKYVVRRDGLVPIIVRREPPGEIPGAEASLFTEIRCFQEREIDADVAAAAFERDDPQAKDQVLKLADEHRDEFTMATDLIAGSIGLRFSPQLVIEPRAQNNLAVTPDGKWVMQNAGDAMEVLDLYHLSMARRQELGDQFTDLRDEDDVLWRNARIMHWLMKVWPERDPVNGFLAFFIPLEMMLDTISGELEEDTRAQAEEIHQLIEAYGGEQKSKLSKVFKRLTDNWRLSLNQRFELFAREAAFPGWEADVQAFKEFNRVRNYLVHGGRFDKLQARVFVGKEKTLRTLEDLAERYVSYAVFGVHDVYLSRWRPTR